MLVEFRDLSAVERELAFSEWCGSHGVKRFLFDLDDTISATRPVYQEKLSQIYDLLAGEVPIKTKEEWKKDVKGRDDRLFEKYAVSPSRWNFVTADLADSYSLSKDLIARIQAMYQSIHETPLKMLEGASEGLEFMHRAGIPIGIVTHAERDWTWRKYKWLNLQRFIDWDEIYVVDAKGHKTKASWADAFRFYGLEPQESAVVGDSPRADINPVWELGVRECFMIDDPTRWVVHDQPVDPSVKLIKRLDEIPEVALTYGL